MALEPRVVAAPCPGRAPVPCRCRERGVAPDTGEAGLGLAAGRTCCRLGHVSVAGLVEMEPG